MSAKSAPGDDFPADATPASQAEREEALSRLDKAIKAHGGAAELEKMQTMKISMEGTLDNIYAEHELKIRFPEHLRLTATLTIGTEKQIIGLGLQPNRVWKTAKGMREDITEPAQIADFRNEQYRFWLTTLKPLKDDKFILRPLATVIINSRATEGIKVDQKGRPTVGLYFDTQSNLLVRMVIPRWQEAGQIKRRIIAYPEYERSHDLMLPKVWSDTRDDRQFAYWAKVTYEFPKQFDDKTFEPPE